jgi:hypothetical protein
LFFLDFFSVDYKHPGHRKILSNLASRKPAEAGQSAAPRYTPLELFDIIGPSPRACYEYSRVITKTRDGPEVDISYDDPDAIFANTHTLQDVIMYGLAPPSKQGEQFHRFFFGENRFSNPSLRDPRFKYKVPTDFLRRLIINHFRKKEMKERFDLLIQFAPLPVIAGMIYESLVPDILQGLDESLPCHLHGDTESPSFLLGPNLFSRPYTVDPEAGLITPVDNCIYVPQAGFPSLNAFVVSEEETRVTMLQITVSKKHDLKLSEIRNVINALINGGLPRGESVKWTVLFVTPDDRGQNIANTAQKTFKSLGKNYPKVKLGWLMVGPDDPKYSAKWVSQ